MPTPKKKTNVQKHEPRALDEIAPLLERIADIAIAECKRLESPNLKERKKAEESIFELGLFGMKLMDRLFPMYVLTMGKLEEVRPLIQKTIGQ